ncbi:hypothetical protein O3M35_001541 [Rhynocoris fuscipes]|uniref:Chemosensory protein n=1 Tax=Rhynocoris fuscipes TaxID=488301 RepID=A0AAW1CUK6_9HEMI
MLKVHLIIVILLLGTICLAQKRYTTKYDRLDLDELLNNDRIYKRYFDCLTRQGKCTPDAKELRDTLPDALKTACAKCSERQKAGAEKVIKFLLKNKPTDFVELEKVYDPKGEYRKRYQQVAREKGIVLP